MSENLQKNQNLSNFDPNQMANLAFDGKKDAFRVTVVDGIDIKVDSISMPEFKFPEQKPVVIKETVIQEVQKVITEVKIEKIEIPVIVKEYEVITVEKPVIMTEVKIIEIEKPVIVKEIQVIEQKIYEIPKIAMICMIIQTIALLGLVVTNLL